MKEDITFQMNLVSYLAAADFASGVRGNINISTYTSMIIYHQQDPHNMDALWIKFLKNGSSIFKNTSPENSRHYWNKGKW